MTSHRQQSIGLECHSGTHGKNSFTPVLDMLHRKGVSGFVPTNGLLDEAVVLHSGKIVVRTINHIKVVLGPGSAQVAAKAYLAVATA